MSREYGNPRAQLRDGRLSWPADREPGKHAEDWFKSGGEIEPSKELARPTRNQKFGRKPRGPAK